MRAFIPKGVEVREVFMLMMLVKPYYLALNN